MHDFMFEPIRGGTRGGQAEFKWSDVSADKDRENYLGHSINAPTGRWQKNKDVHWYSRDETQQEIERAEEIRKIKEAEADALAVALGFAPAPKAADGTGATGANATAIGKSEGGAPKYDPEAIQRTLEKEERRKRKAERKEEKRLKKELKKQGKTHRHSQDDGDENSHGEHKHGRSHDRDHGPARRSSRSRSPLPRRADPTFARRRSRSRSPLYSLERDPRRVVPTDYDDSMRERGRESDRRRWDANRRDRYRG
ncbi:hypothetical protein FISHEDRAFT_62291 [Fistulina hepatica ATCC 64428]|nr:hypothetical protein FISHEDRAFT_62291 [Fistulina hepatica ATCC 64428]